MVNDYLFGFENHKDGIETRKEGVILIKVWKRKLRFIKDFPIPDAGG
jgi:hypothetical protein